MKASRDHRNRNGDINTDMDGTSDDAADDDDGKDVTPSVAALEAVAKAMRRTPSKLSVATEEGEEEEAMTIGTVPNAAAIAAIAAAAAPVKWGKEGAEERRAAAAAAMVSSPPGGDGLTDLWPFQKDKLLRRRGSRGSECSTDTSLMSGYSSVYRRGPSSALGQATNGGGGGGPPPATAGGEKNSDRSSSSSSSSRRTGNNNNNSVNHSFDRLETRHEEERGGEWRGAVRTSPAVGAAAATRVSGDGIGNGSLSPSPPSYEAAQEAARLGVVPRVGEGWRGKNGETTNDKYTLGEFLELPGGGGGGGDNDSDAGGGVGGGRRARQGGGSDNGDARPRRYSWRNSEGSLQFTGGEGFLPRDEAGGGDRSERVSSLKVLKPKVEVFLDNEDGEWGQTPTNSRFWRLWWPGR